MIQFQVKQLKRNLNANGFAIGNVLDRDKLEAFP